MQFDEQSVKRIAKTVQRVEREAFPARRRPRQRFTPFGDSLPTVPCLNSSGFVIPPYGLVKVSGQQDGRVTCVRPNAVWGTYLVNEGSEVPIGGEFRAKGCGLVTFAGTTAGPGYYGPTPNSFLCMAGALIEHYIGGQGNLDPPDVLFGKPLANISSGGSGSMVLYAGALTALSPQITVPISRAFAALTTDKFMSAVHNMGNWYGLPAECSTAAAAPTAGGDGVEFGTVLGIDSLGV